MSRFEGKSSLREKDEAPAGPSQKQLDLQAYLEANYSSKPAKKKKNKSKTGTTSSLRVVDSDVTGFAPVEEKITVKEADPDAPVVVNSSEATAFERLQQKKKEKTKTGGWHTVETGGEINAEGINDDTDLSPPRKTLYDVPKLPVEAKEDLSPPRRRAATSSSTSDYPDLSPPRRSRHGLKGGNPKSDEDEDMSPPRKPSSSTSKNPREGRRMMDGSATGVLSAEQMKEEIRRKRHEDRERMSGLADEATGRGAETVYRSKDGKRVTLEELERENAKEKKKIKWEKVEWDSGLVQQQNTKRLKAELEREKQKPFARARDDEDLDALYRARRRWGDPMGHLDKKSKTTNPQLDRELPPVIDETNRHWFEKSGFVIPQETPPHSWIRRGVAALSNRYNIRPGRHWDGVDRSNGFEKEYAKYLNECAARDKEAAMWCMEDM